MVKHTQTIRRLLPMKCLSVFNHLRGWGLRVNNEQTALKSAYPGLLKGNNRHPFNVYSSSFLMISGGIEDNLFA